jgi:hypothetical protein
MATAEPQPVPERVAADEEVELLRGSVQAGVVAQSVIAVAAAVGLI